MSSVTVCNCPQNTPDPAWLRAVSSRPSDQQQKKPDGRTCWAGSVERRLDDCWQNADAVRPKRSGLGPKPCRGSLQRSPRLSSCPLSKDLFPALGIRPRTSRCLRDKFLANPMVSMSNQNCCKGFRFKEKIEKHCFTCFINPLSLTLFYVNSVIMFPWCLNLSYRPRLAYFMWSDLQGQSRSKSI